MDFNGLPVSLLINLSDHSAKLESKGNLYDDLILDFNTEVKQFASIDVEKIMNLLKDLVERHIFYDEENGHSDGNGDGWDEEGEGDEGWFDEEEDKEMIIEDNSSTQQIASTKSIKLFE